MIIFLERAIFVGLVFFLVGCSGNGSQSSLQQSGLNTPNRAPINSMQYMYRSPPIGFSGVHGR